METHRPFHYYKITDGCTFHCSVQRPLEKLLSLLGAPSFSDVAKVRACFGCIMINNRTRHGLACHDYSWILQAGFCPSLGPPRGLSFNDLMPMVIRGPARFSQDSSHWFPSSAPSSQPPAQFNQLPSPSSVPILEAEFIDCLRYRFVC